MTLSEEDEAELGSMPQVEETELFYSVAKGSYDSYDLIFADENAFGMGLIPLSEGAGFSETGIGANGLPEVILCGQAFDETPVGGYLEVRFSVLMQQLHAVGRVSAPWEILTGTGAESRDITADNLMTQEAVLIVKDTPEVREMVDGYYPDFTLQCGGICFVQLKETLTQEQFSQTVEQLRESWNVTTVEELAGNMNSAASPDLTPYFVKAAVFLLLSFAALTGLCLRTLQKSKEELRLRLQYGTSRFTAGLPLFLNLCLPALLAAVLTGLHMTVRYRLDLRIERLPDVLRSVIGIYPYDKLYDLPCLLCFLFAVLLAVLIPTFSVAVAVRWAQKGD